MLAPSGSQHYRLLKFLDVPRAELSRSDVQNTLGERKSSLGATLGVALGPGIPHRGARTGRRLSLHQLFSSSRRFSVLGAANRQAASSSRRREGFPILFMCTLVQPL